MLSFIFPWHCETSSKCKKHAHHWSFELKIVSRNSSSTANRPQKSPLENVNQKHRYLLDLDVGEHVDNLAECEPRAAIKLHDHETNTQDRARGRLPNPGHAPPPDACQIPSRTLTAYISTFPHSICAIPSLSLHLLCYDHGSVTESSTWVFKQTKLNRKTVYFIYVSEYRKIKSVFQVCE